MELQEVIRPTTTPTATNRSIPIKFRCQDEIRRWSVAEDQLNSLTFDRLEHVVWRLFFSSKSNPGNLTSPHPWFKIQYRDDEDDYITMSSNMELQAAIEYFQTTMPSSSTPGIWTFFIQPCAQSSYSASPCPPMWMITDNSWVLLPKQLPESEFHRLNKKENVICLQLSTRMRLCEIWALAVVYGEVRYCIFGQHQAWLEFKRQEDAHRAIKELNHKVYDGSEIFARPFVGELEQTTGDPRDSTPSNHSQSFPIENAHTQIDPGVAKDTQVEINSTDCQPESDSPVEIKKEDDYVAQNDLNMEYPPAIVADAGALGNAETSPTAPTTIVKDPCPILTQKLRDMGFEFEQIVPALQKSRGNIEQALEDLLSA